MFNCTKAHALFAKTKAIKLFLILMLILIFLQVISHFSPRFHTSSFPGSIPTLHLHLHLHLQARQAMGVFTVCPCSGYLQPGAQQVVTVDCAAEQLGAWSESLAIDVSDRDPSDHPDGFPYRLAANVCVPGRSPWQCKQLNNVNNGQFVHGGRLLIWVELT